MAYSPNFAADNTIFVAVHDGVSARAFANELAQRVAAEDVADVAALGALTLASGGTVEAGRVALVQKIGENIAVRRFAR